jgi:hypothetical protein
MQIAAETAISQSLQFLLGAAFPEFSATLPQSAFSQHTQRKLIRRNGVVAGFEQSEISVAASKESLARLRFDDGLAGSAPPGDFLKTCALGGRVDAKRNCSAAVDPTAATIIWDGGIQLDSGIPHQDLLWGRLGNEFIRRGLP